MVKKSDIGDATKDDSVSAAKVVQLSSKALRRKKVSFISLSTILEPQDKAAGQKRTSFGRRITTAPGSTPKAKPGKQLQTHGNALIFALLATTDA